MSDTIATNPYPLIRYSDEPHGDIAAIARYWTPVDDGLDLSLIHISEPTRRS